MAGQRESKKVTIQLPIADSLPNYRGPVYLAHLIIWLERDKADADVFRMKAIADADDKERAFWTGYGDALTNVLHHLTGPGE